MKNIKKIILKLKKIVFTVWVSFRKFIRMIYDCEAYAPLNPTLYIYIENNNKKKEKEKTVVYRYRAVFLFSILEMGARHF